MNFKETVKSLKRKHLVLVLTLGISLLILWILKNCRIINDPIITKPQITIALQYASILITGIAIWYGYHNYEQKLKEFKDSQDEETKHSNFLNTKNLQNNLLYFALFANIVLFGLTTQNQFALLACISLVISAINFPTIGKYNRDYCEPEIDDEKYETEINNSLKNELNQNFSSEPKVDNSKEIQREKDDEIL